MHILNSYTLKYLKLNKKRTIVTIIGIILSCAMIAGVTSLTASFKDMLVRQAIKENGNYHATFMGVKYENAKYITQSNHTKQSSITADIGYAVLEGSKNEHKPYVHIRAFDSSSFETQPMKLITGRFPKNKDELLISDHIISNSQVKLKVGDKITLDIGDRTLEGHKLNQNNPYEGSKSREKLVVREQKTYTITGIIERPRFEYYSAPGYSVFTYLDPQSLPSDALVDVSILVKNLKNIYDNTAQMAENAGMEYMEYSPNGYDVQFNNELLRWNGVSHRREFNAFIESLALIIIVLIMVGAVTVIYNSFSISVSERKKHFGMLRSVGATAAQIRKTVFFEALIVGLIGIPLGILGGIVGISVTLKVANNLIQGLYAETPSLYLVVSPWSIIAAVFFTGLTILISAFIPAKRASRISPVDAIRLNTDIKRKGKIKSSRLARFVFGFEGELALKSLKRNRKKYATTVFSLFISIVLFISFSSFSMYLMRFNDSYYQEYNFDLSLSMGSVSQEYHQNFINKVKNLPKVDQYSIITSIGVTFNDTDGDKINSYALENFEDYYLRNGEGPYKVYIGLHALENDNFDSYAKDLGLNPQDFKDQAKPRVILINKNIVKSNIIHEFELFNIKKGEDMEVAGFTKSPDDPPNKIVLNIGEVTHKAPMGVTINNYYGSMVISTEILNQLLKTFEAEDIQFSPVLYLKSDEATTLEQEITKLYNEDKEGDMYLHNIHSSAEQNRKMKALMSLFIYGFITLITLIGVTNIFNTINTNIELRRREFAMLKSVGLTPASFSKILNYECIFYGLKALLYGLPVSILISYQLFKSFSNITSSGFILPWGSIIGCIVAVFAIVFATMIYSSSKLKKDNIIDAIKAENL